MFFRFLGFVSVFQSLLFLGHWFLFSTVVDIFKIQGFYPLQLLGAVFVILWISFTLSWFFVMGKYGKWRVRFYYASSIWIGTGHLLIMASVIYWLLKITDFVFTANWPLTTIGKILYLVALLASVYGIWNSYNIRTHKYNVALPNLPEFWKGKKIVMFADSHLGNIRGLGFAKKVANKVAEQKPDLVLIPGDFYDGPPAPYQELANAFKDIAAPQGIYFVNGNHEEFRDSHPFVHALSRAGVKIVNNTFVEINGLQIVGVSYHKTNTKNKFKKVLAGINFDPSKPSILMKHVPSALKIANAAKINLVVSGHTHKGQMFPFNIVTKMIFKGYDGGLKLYGDMQVLTTSGVGTWGPPQRVGTNSEITVIILQGAE